MLSDRAKQLLAELPNQHGLTPDELWANRDAGEVGNLDLWAKHYGLTRGGYWPSTESMHGSEARKRAWLAKRESDESLRKRVAAAIEATE
jgi:hypothetical protein